MPHVLISNVFGNPNVGLYVYCNDRFCLVPVGTPGSLIEKFSEVLKVPVYPLSIAGTTLLGVFLAGNRDTLLVPEIAFENELLDLEKFGIKYSIVHSRLTALGNNIVCNGNACIVNPEYSDSDMKEIGEALGMPVLKGTINELGIVGAMAAVNSRGGIVSADILPNERKAIESALKIRLHDATVNFGSPFVSSGVVTNAHGFIIGETSSGPEVANIDEGLGFTEG